MVTDAEILEVLDDARVCLFAGLVSNSDALAEAVERGLVERTYGGAGALMGVAKLRLTEAGRAKLGAE